jgi:hypothetical protein
MSNYLLGKGAFANMDVDSMSDAQRGAFIVFLVGENTELKLLNGTLIAEIDTLSKKNTTLIEKNSDLHSKATDAHLLAEQNEELKKSVELLQAENSLLKSENELLKNKLAEYEERIAVLEARDEPITIREAIRILESFICLEAVGNSKTKFKNGLYNFDAFSRYGDSANQSDLKDVLTKRGLTFDHCKVMAYLKDCGDFGAHASIPNLTKDEWFQVILGDEEAEASIFDNEKEKNELLAAASIKRTLLSVLEHYIPCPTSNDEFWNIKHPVAKPMKSPVLNLSAGAK